MAEEIATQSEAAAIGGGTASENLRCVTKTKALDLGCEISDNDSRTDKLLVPISKLLSGSKNFYVYAHKNKLYYVYDTDFGSEDYPDLHDGFLYGYWVNSHYESRMREITTPDSYDVSDYQVYDGKLYIATVSGRIYVTSNMQTWSTFNLDLYNNAYSYFNSNGDLSSSYGKMIVKFSLTKSGENTILDDVVYFNITNTQVLALFYNKNSTRTVTTLNTSISGALNCYSITSRSTTALISSSDTFSKQYSYSYKVGSHCFTSISTTKKRMHILAVHKESLDLYFPIYFDLSSASSLKWLPMYFRINLDEHFYFTYASSKDVTLFAFVDYGSQKSGRITHSTGAVTLNLNELCTIKCFATDKYVYCYKDKEDGILVHKITITYYNTTSRYSGGEAYYIVHEDPKFLIIMHNNTYISGNCTNVNSFSFSGILSNGNPITSDNHSGQYSNFDYLIGGLFAYGVFRSELNYKFDGTIFKNY